MIIPRLLSNRETPVEYIDKHVHHLHPDIRFYNRNMDEPFWWRFCDLFAHKVNWVQLAIHPGLSESFWHHQCKQYPHRVQWIELCSNSSLSETFWRNEIEVHEEYIPWTQLCTSEKLSSTFWDEMVTRFPLDVDWTNLSLKSLELWFVEKHLDRMHWRELVWNTSLTKQFWVKRCTEQPQRIDWVELSNSPFLGSDFWETQINNPHIQWRYLCRELDEPFWEKHLDKVNWNMLAWNPRISASFWTRHASQAPFHQLCATEHLPVEFWEEQCRLRPHSLDWEQLAVNPRLGADFWERQLQSSNASFIQWTWLSLAFLPLEFWKPRIQFLSWKDYIYDNHLSQDEWIQYADCIDVNDAVWNVSSPVQFWESKNLDTEFLPSCRRMFLRYRSFPLSFWRRWLGNRLEPNLYSNTDFVRRSVVEQLIKFMSSP